MSINLHLPAGFASFLNMLLDMMLEIADCNGVGAEYHSREAYAGGCSTPHANSLLKRLAQLAVSSG